MLILYNTVTVLNVLIQQIQSNTVDNAASYKSIHGSICKAYNAHASSGSSLYMYV